MAYVLEAVIGKQTVLANIATPGTCQVTLQDGFGMIPVTDKLIQALKATNELAAAEPIERFGKFSDSVASWLGEISQKGPVAYVEIETFGGSGEKAAIVYKNGAAVLGPLHREDAVNHALHFLGVQSIPPRSSASLSEDFSARGMNYAKGERDEFDQLNLGRHRFTRDWVETA